MRIESIRASRSLFAELPALLVNEGPLGLRHVAHVDADARLLGEVRAELRQEPGGSVRGERANLKGLVLGCIEVKLCK